MSFEKILEKTNFFVVNHPSLPGEFAVRMNVSLLVDPDYLMEHFTEIQRSLQEIDGVIQTHIDDIPPVLVSRTIRKWAE
jgi:hypothetical protein